MVAGLNPAVKKKSEHNTSKISLLLQQVLPVMKSEPTINPIKWINLWVLSLPLSPFMI